VELQPSVEFSIALLATNMEQVRALYDFAPATAQEVGFAKGDVISNVVVVDENWWRGTTPNGSYGLFPWYAYYTHQPSSLLLFAPPPRGLAFVLLLIFVLGGGVVVIMWRE
jgi:hypothetical protein